MPRTSNVSEAGTAWLNELRLAIRKGKYGVPSRELATEFARTFMAATKKHQPIESTKQLTRVGLLRRIGNPIPDPPIERGPSAEELSE